jgi:hypothetical protein
MASAETGEFLTWISTSSPTSFVFPLLPYHLTLLPSIFRFLAFLFFLPVLVLALVSLLGMNDLRKQS